jgi:S1-C subfamily serine protease
MKILIFLAFFGLSSCIPQTSTTKFVNKKDDVFHSQNVVKVEFVFAEDCTEVKCKTSRFIRTYGTGIILRKDLRNTATILTVGHLCEEYVISLNKFGKGRNVLKMYNSKMETFEAEVSSYQMKNDTCILKAKHYFNEIEKISLRDDKLIPGEEIFNIGAPTGLFSYNMVNRFRGFYAGYVAIGSASNIRNVFNFPAVEGSSGSPIFDSDGFLIGIVSMFSKDFNYIILSPTLGDLRKLL